MTDQDQLSTEELYDGYTAQSGGGLFTKFPDDKEVRVRIMSEPYISNNKFTDKETGEVRYSNYHAWVVLNRTESDKPQIMQLPGGPYNDIAMLVKDPEYGNVSQYDLKITRKNTNGKYSYSVNASPKRSPITDEEKVAVMSVDVVAALGKDGTPVLSLRDYLKNGKRFPDAIDTDGSPKIKDL